MKTTSERELSTTAISPNIEISPPQRPTLPNAARRVPLFLGDVTIMVDSDNSARFPGWYDDPSDSTVERFWDGRQWTESFRDAATAQAAKTDVLVDLTSVQATVGALPANDRPVAAEPTKVVPTTPVPPTPVPTTPVPTTPVPAAPELKDAFAKDVPAADAVLKAQPAAETAPIAEIPPAETPRAETPRAETPRAETPRSETPRSEAPPVRPVESLGEKAAAPLADAAQPAQPTIANVVSSPPAAATPPPSTPPSTPTTAPSPAVSNPVEPSMGLFSQRRTRGDTSASEEASPSVPDAASRPSLFDKRAEATQKSTELPLRSAPREKSSAETPQPSSAAKPAVTSMADIIRTTTVAAAQSEAGTAKPTVERATSDRTKTEQTSTPAPAKPAPTPKVTPRPKADIPKPKPIESPVKTTPVEPKVARPAVSTPSTDDPSQKRWGALALLAGACLAAGGFLFGYLAGGSDGTAAPAPTTEAPTTTITQTEPIESAVDQDSLDALAAAEARVEELESASASSSDQVASLEGEVAELTEARDNESAHNELLQSWFTADVLSRSQGSWDAEVARGCGLADEPTLENLNYARRLEVIGTPADLLAAVLDCRG